MTAKRHIITHCVKNNKSARFRIKSLLETLVVLPSSGISYSGPPVSRCSVIGEDVLSCSSKLFSTPQRANHLHSRPSSAQNLLPSTPLRSGLQQANRTFTEPAWVHTEIIAHYLPEVKIIPWPLNAQVQFRLRRLQRYFLIRIFTLGDIRCSHRGEHVNYTWKGFFRPTQILCSSDFCQIGRPVDHKSCTCPPSLACLTNIANLMNVLDK